LPKHIDRLAIRSRADDGEELRSARLSVCLVALAVGAELLQLQPIGVVASVLLGDVVAVLALDARQRDLRANIRGFAGHGSASFTIDTGRYRVAEAGLEPTTQRL
jgi:hypothetical protein